MALPSGSAQVPERTGLAGVCEAVLLDYNLTLFPESVMSYVGQAQITPT
jgi:hypothetical protein